jgi:sulfonate transport system permease protein
MAMIQGLVPAVVILALWELGARFLFDPRFIGEPSAIAAYLVTELGRGPIWHDVAVTFSEILLGYAIGTVVGFAAGFALGFRHRLARLLEPYILIFSAIPKIAIAPIIIIALGIGIESKVAIVVSMVFFLMFYAVYAAVRQIEIDFIHQARLMGANRLQVVLFVVMPAIAPSIMGGLKTSIVYAVIGAMLGEFIASQSGLGFYVLNASGAFNVNGIWVGVVLIVSLVFALTTLIGMAERRLLRWLPNQDTGQNVI